jgi:nucleoside-diphosphate-sugar epimerase
VILQVLALPGSDGEVSNVASGKIVSFRTIIEKVCTLTGSGKPQYREVSFRPGGNMALYANISKGKKILQWEPTTNIDIGLQKTINYFDNKHHA